MAGEKYEKENPHGELAAAAAVIVGLLVLYVCARLLLAYSRTLAALICLVLLAGSVLLIRHLRARPLRRLPARDGLALGSVRIGRHLRRRAAFFLPWDSLLQHVLVDGPTGLGKSTSIIRPLVSAIGESEQVGMFYLDGKGAPLRDAERYFDAIFDPANPASSASWNPLAGGRPEYAGHRFAEALYADVPEGQAGQFYVDRAKLALRHAVIAIAYTGYRGEVHKGEVRREVLTGLLRVGFSEDEALAYMGESLPEAHRQLHYLPYRRDKGKAGFDSAFRRRAAGPARAAGYSSPFGRSHRLHRCVPRIKDVHRVLFDEASMNGIARFAAVAAERTGEDSVATSADFLRTLAASKVEWRVHVLANLEAKLTPFLMPPFNTLCNHDDLRIAEVVKGRKVALLLPQGGNNAGAAAQLGRVGLALYQTAVLSPKNLKRGGGYSGAVMDEFAPFVTPSFPAFLAQAREHRAFAVMAVQSISQLRAAGEKEDILANASSVIVTSGQERSDAEYWSKTFGAEEHQVVSSQRLGKKESAGVIVDKKLDRMIRTEILPRWRPEEIAELPPFHVLVRVRLGQKTYPPYLVDVEIRQSARKKLSPHTKRAGELIGRALRRALNIKQKEVPSAQEA